MFCIFIQFIIIYLISTTVSSANDIRYGSLFNYSQLVSDKNFPCTSQIYCYGPLLHTVQMAQVFNDSKTFVDLKMNQPENVTLKLFENFMNETHQKPTKDDIKKFVMNNFGDVNTEFDIWTPSDWKENPKYLNQIKNEDLRWFGNEINQIWFKLGRKIKKDVALHPDLYSLIYLPHPFIIPGGRFREIYYWDSFWIVKGLLHSEMYDTVKGMLQNFLLYIEYFGYIPNGGRYYDVGRSQLPVLAKTIKMYVETTNDYEFAIEAVKLLDKEFTFWVTNRNHTINGFTLMAYGNKADALGPRPESYIEDYKTAEPLQSDHEKYAMYAELQAAAETGFDFSSRWFITSDGGRNGHLNDTKVRSVLPVELNSLLCENAKIISEFYSLAGDTSKAIEFIKKSIELEEAIHKVLWNDSEGVWLDYDLINNKHRNYFAITNLMPLTFRSYNSLRESYITDRILEHINETGIDYFPGGVPITLYHTGEQWDYPNVWPPTFHAIIEGMGNLKDPRAQLIAFKWAERWIQSNFVAFKRTHIMYEKYNAEEVGGTGGGGEYNNQYGFGWTNGVVIDLLAKYGQRLTVP